MRITLMLEDMYTKDKRQRKGAVGTPTTICIAAPSGACFWVTQIGLDRQEAEEKA